jgi:CotH kinase protein/Secretion system C-terminal sorting domain
MKSTLLSLSLLIVCSLNIIGQTFTSSTLPIIKITVSKSSTIANEPKVLAIMEIIDNGKGKTNALTDKANIYNGKIGIEYRGSTSQDLFPKKPYGLELWADSAGTKTIKSALFGFPEESDWILNATYNDKTLMRDVLAYSISNKMGRYATRAKYCEVFINGKYEGIYILMEKIKKDKGRVDISTLKKTDNTGDDVTGGYIVKIDKSTGSGRSKSFTTANNTDYGNFRTTYLIDYPNAFDITDQQYNYIQSFMNEFENSLKAADFLSPDAKWRKLANIDSFVDYLIITEINKNIDGYRLSTYFYKDKDSKGGKMTMGPAWDYNLAWGNADYYEGYLTTGWTYDAQKLAVASGDFFAPPFWWYRLTTDTTFNNKLGRRWRSLRQNILKTENVHKYIDSTANELRVPAARNFEKWPVLGRKIWPNYYVGTTYQDEVNWMKDWIRLRLDWMDGKLDKFGTVLSTDNPFDNQKYLKVFPNPSNDITMVEYEVLSKGQVSINVYDQKGGLVETLVDEVKNAGKFQTKPSKKYNTGLYIIDYQINNLPLERAKMIKQ